MARLASVLLAGTVAVLVFLGAWASLRDVVLRFVHDDAFYYFEIARRIGSGQGSTCDGINPTNGYHPLWLVALLPLAPLMEASRDAGVRAAAALSALTLGGAFWLLHRAARQIAPREAPLAILFAWAALSVATIYGMESPLAALLLAAVLAQLARSGVPGRPRQGVVIGFTSGLLVLSRLDSALYVLAFDALWAAELLRRRGDPEARLARRVWLTCLLVQASVVLPYLIVNQAFFGHPFPVSSLVKAGRRTGLSLAWLKSTFAKLGVGSAVLAAVATAVRRTGPGLFALRVAASGTLLWTGVIALTGGRETYNWYFMLPVLCAGLFVAAIGEELGARRIVGVALRTWVVLGCLGLFALTLAGRRKPSGFVEEFDRAVWIAAHAPKEAVFAAPDCGILGYVSQHAFVNTDGLTNSFDFQRALREDGLPQWLVAAGVNAVALKAGVPPRRLPDGTYRQQIAVRRGMRGEQRAVHAVLEPWEPASESGPYRLWRIVRIEPGKVPE